MSSADLLKLRGLVAIVTAGSKGLGFSSALALARGGARVAISARSPGPLQAAAEAIASTTGRPDEVLAIAGDATEQAGVDEVVRSTLDKWGQCDILVSNNGGPKAGTFLDLQPEDWEEASRQTLMSLVRACYAVTPHMIERGTGSIVTIQSATVKNGVDNLVLSNSLRLANVGLVRSLATELGPKGIRVNSINPGLHATDRLESLFEHQAGARGVPVDEVRAAAAANIPLRRVNDPDNFGENVAWLASPAAAYITGQAIIVDGGNARSPL